MTLQVSHATDRSLFSDERRLTLPFAGLVPESTVVVVLETEERPAQFPLPWTRHVYSATFDPTEYFAVNVRFHPKRPAAGPHLRR